MRTCKIEGCERKYKAKGCCSKHYQKLCKYGDPLYSKIEMHGLTKIPEYWVYASMKQRCYDKNNKSYNRYGGRGITVCERWRNSFTAFFEDMGLKPFPEAQLDRVLNDGNYELSNCRWVTRTKNIRNASCTKLTIEKIQQIKKLKKEGKSLRILSYIYNVSKTTICDIINQKTWKEV